MPPLLLYRTPGWIRTNACTILSRVPLPLGYKGVEYFGIEPNSKMLIRHLLTTSQPYSKVEQVGLEPTIAEL